MSHPQNAFGFKDLDAESYLAKRLGHHGVNVFTGTTDRADRIQRFRDAILTGGLTAVIIGRSAVAKKTETYREYFERIFGEALEPKAKRGAA
jgi:hypothetical protein